MDFLSSPVHNYSYETFDDAFFDLPKEMDFELNDDLKDSLSYGDSDDLNDGMYGIWNAKHPWSVNNNSSSIYNSNLHLDFIGGDPESAMMVNPNIVIPSGFQFDDEVIKISTDEKEESSVPSISSFSSQESKECLKEDTILGISKKKSKLLSLKENLVNTEDNNGSSNLKNGVRVLKPSGQDSGISSPQPKNEHASTRLKNSSKNSMFYQDGQFYPKPAFSYSCLIAMALKNSKHGCLPVAEIYNFMCNHFPYFKTAPNGWKNSVRHNLSLNKCFEKIEKPAGSAQRKGCLWALNPSKAAKLEEEVLKCAKKDVTAIKRAMEYPEHLELLERGELKSLYDSELGMEEDEFDDDDDDLDVNDESDVEEPMVEEETIQEKLSEDEVLESHKRNVTEKYLTSNVDDNLYEELVGSIKNDQLFSLKQMNGGKNGSGKKPKKYFIQVNRDGKNSSFPRKSDIEIYDHYDINNLLRFENETKLTANKKAARFNRRDSSTSRIKPIKFKTWN